MKDGADLPPGRSNSLAWFPARGSEESDGVKVVRAPEDTRPPAGKQMLSTRHLRKQML